MEKNIVCAKPENAKRRRRAVSLVDVSDKCARGVCVTPCFDSSGTDSVPGSKHEQLREALAYYVDI